MARKVFLSFLGATNYSPSKYYIDGEKPIETRYVQIASFMLNCKDFEENDKIFIFTTPTAKERNWKDDFEFKKPSTNEIIKNKGLKTEFEQIEIKPQISQETAIDIPEETSENKIWDTFKIVFDQIEPEDEIVFDITHGFRSSPMLLMVLINYAKFLKKITIRRINYGAFEARDKEKNETRIWDLTNFAVLQDWTSGADIFVNFGNAKRIKEISSENIAEKMQDVMRLFATVRGGEIVDGLQFEKLKTEIKKFKKDLSKKDIEVPLLPIISYMEKAIAGFKRSNVANGISAIQFCIENDLIQQAFTLMQEMIISYILDLENEKYANKISRIVLSACFQISKDKYETRLNEFEKKDKKKVDSENRLVDKLYASKYISYFADIYSKLTQYRNDFNHAGTKGNARPAEEFYNEAINFYNEINYIIEKINNSHI